jgi:hypothetical protein
MDCTYGDQYRSNRCKGGYLAEAFMFAKTSYLASRDEYPYKGKGKPCRQKESMVIPDQDK